METLKKDIENALNKLQVESFWTKRGTEGCQRAPYIMSKDARGTRNRDAGGLWSIIFCKIYF